MIEPLVIEHEGKPTHVVLSYAEWERIREIVEDAEDAAAVAAVLSDPNQDRVPSDVVARLLDDENPVKVWREQRGVTQAQLAKAADLPQPTIAMIETGRRKGTVNQMKAIAAALEINLDTLVS
jgi:DNA-binding XRE family transcriptional regulator